ncbi:hypothetical protein [Frankia sp. R82]|uniref:hypothetical protein n=1 Tax=Frankia sp. R82 TaxID=2950553 RepID=UPI002044C372|nr:hypothetical protein [Frankia sp. R82]MCM3885310.1 hypothetical protein [Frankia sp. R82]
MSRRSLNTVHGTVNLQPAALTRTTTWAVFAIDGPQQTVRTVRRAPFVLQLDTRPLPSGQYTISIIVFSAARAPAFETVRLTVNNAVATPTTQPTAAPRAAPATAAPPAATAPPTTPPTRPPTATLATTPPATVPPQAVRSPAAITPTTPSRLSQLPTATFAAGQKF